MTHAIATGWSATKDHGDNCPSVITMKLTEYDGDNQITLRNETPGDEALHIWDEFHLAELIAGLLAAAEQADWDMATVYAYAGIEQ